MKSKKLLWFLPLFLLIGIIAIQVNNQSSIDNISIDELANQQNEKDKNTIFVDVREPSEYEAGHIDGMMNLPLSTLEQEYKKLSKQSEIILICRSGNRSAQAANILEEHGYQNIKNVQGGIQAWDGPLVQ